MADILQDLLIRVPPHRAFEGVSQPVFLDRWWTLRSTGVPAVGTVYELDFGPGCVWRAVVRSCRPAELFELRLTEADRDWTDTVVGFELTASDAGTQVAFSHRGWPEPNPHYRTSCHCWALYLRLLRRHLEHGVQEE
ncbi:MAG: SRPBCC domain-containing protein [Acidobacteria bacterium]|nr:SRPBCC domain-containing protein [Acidobacteriota bacterium]